MQSTSSTGRNYTAVDRVIGLLDEGLRLVSGSAPEASRENPAGDLPDTAMEESERHHVAGLMRVNHAGEICAQALYAGQAASARNPDVRDKMQHAAQEEIDHLAWCEQRLTELGDQPSALNPLWYAGSFALGTVAGLAGDGWSLGFLKETEEQVEAHLEEHLQKLPADDQRSQAILAQMKLDEASHAETAAAAGATELPQLVREAMRFTAQVMKSVAYRF